MTAIDFPTETRPLGDQILTEKNSDIGHDIEAGICFLPDWCVGCPDIQGNMTILSYEPARIVVGPIANCSYSVPVESCFDGEILSHPIREVR